MVRVIKLVLTPVRYFWIFGIVIGFGSVVSTVDFPSNASAESAIGCQRQLEDNECPQEEVVDVCPNIDKEQPVVPDGYYVDQTQRGACVKEPEPQVLGDSTTETPQVLAETAVVSGK